MLLSGQVYQTGLLFIEFLWNFGGRVGKGGSSVNKQTRLSRSCHLTRYDIAGNRAGQACFKDKDPEIIRGINK